MQIETQIEMLKTYISRLEGYIYENNEKQRERHLKELMGLRDILATLEQHDMIERAYAANNQAMDHLREQHGRAMAVVGAARRYEAGHAITVRQSSDGIALVYALEALDAAQEPERE